MVESATLKTAASIAEDTAKFGRWPNTRRWTALGNCGFAAVCFALTLQLVPVLAQQQEASSLTTQVMQWRTARLTPEEVGELQSDVARNREDITARTRLIFHYLVAGMNEPRASHVLWMIEHHPEAEVHQFQTLFGDPGPLQDIPSYSRAAVLWKQQVALHANDPRVILNAAEFFDIYYGFYVGDLYQAEEWIRRAHLLIGADRSHARNTAISVL